MTYEDLVSLRDMSDEDAERAWEMTAAVEQVLEENSFRGMPRSVRTAGLGYGCMEIFCRGGKYMVVRNNGLGLGMLPPYESAKECFMSLVTSLFGLRKPKDFAEKQYLRIFESQSLS